MPNPGDCRLAWVAALGRTPARGHRQRSTTLKWPTHCFQRPTNLTFGVRRRVTVSPTVSGGAFRRLCAQATDPSKLPENDGQDANESGETPPAHINKAAGEPTEGYDAHVRERLRDWRAFRMQLVRNQLARKNEKDLNEATDATTNATQAADSFPEQVDERKPPEEVSAGARPHSKSELRPSERKASPELDWYTHTNLDLRWAHPVTTLETGNILVASPEHFRSEQQYFAHTVILILEHGPDGTTGVILNRRAAQRMSMVRSLTGTDLARVFAQDALYLGGPVGLDSLLVLHDESILATQGDRSRPSGELSDIAHEIVPGGVYCGGLRRLTDLAHNGLLTRPERVRFFCGYCGWEPDQLQSEIDQGVWYVASASAELILGPRATAGSTVPRSRRTHAENNDNYKTNNDNVFSMRDRSWMNVNSEDSLAALRAQAVSHVVESPITLWREVVQKLSAYGQLMNGFPGATDT
jgi:putative AlgH/UPF0301 family transcriptional regulator